MIPAIERYPSLARLVERQLAVFPEHKDYMERRFANKSEARFQFDDFVADKILRIAQDEVDVFCEAYRWLCLETLNEELHFRRTGRYRLSSFEEANREIYSNREYMARYVKA